MIGRLSEGSQRALGSRSLRLGLTLLLLVPYSLYLLYVVRTGTGPVDYETFMDLGSSLLMDGEVYGENSYYPLPYVFVFTLFSLIPRPVSLAIWLGGPVLVALAVVGFKPFALVFAPVFSHFLGGQSSVFALLGFTGYRSKLEPTNAVGGLLLALTTLKPHLALVPVGYAAYEWISYYRQTTRIPRQALAFLGMFGLIYAPAFALRPSWLGEWLRVPRPLFQRALSGALPRLLHFVSTPAESTYWILWAVLSALLVWAVWRWKANGHPLDVLLLTSFVVNPLVHDYDLIQVLPMIRGPIMPLASVVLSIPGWWTILTSYSVDGAWITFIIIAPGLLAAHLYQRRRGISSAESREATSP